MSPEFLEDVLENAAANLAFGVLVLVSLSVCLLILMYVGIAIRAGWRWLHQITWNRVILFAERKALRRY